VPQVRFRRAAGAFDQHEIARLSGAREAVEHEAHQVAFHGLVGRRLRGRNNPALHDDLRPRFALRLEQHRVHVNAGRNAGRARLQRLGAPISPPSWVTAALFDMSALTAAPHGAVGEGARQPSHDQRLADVRARALEHECARRHRQNSMPACAFTPAAK